MPDKTDYPAHALASGLLKAQRACAFCGQQIVKGYTNRGNTSWFDPAPPHVNHWVTCPERKTAAATFRKAARR